MNESDDLWELIGYVLWTAGVLLFAVASVVNGDPLSFVGSVLFLAGLVAVMIPLVRSRANREP